MIVSSCGNRFMSPVTQRRTGHYSAVKTAFINDPVVGAARIDVDTFKGVVTLSGRVKSKDEETKAIALARTVNGVTDVKSALQIQP